MKNENGFILIIIAAAIYFINKNKTGLTPIIVPGTVPGSGTIPAPAPSTSTLSITDLRRTDIINYWKQTTSQVDQLADNGRFEDIIMNITGNEIDIIYEYVFSYLANGVIPLLGTVFYNDITAIKQQYKIFL